jgi:hypothetical protein
VVDTVRMPGPTGESISKGARRAVYARRIPQPASCGCGSPVAFDIEKHEFFCIGCGAAKECTCLRSLWSSTVRPVNVA